MRTLALAGLVLLGCDSSQTLPDGPCAVEGVTGSVPGVSLAIRADACVFARGEAARFTYEVTTTASVPSLLVPDSGGGCGDCSGHTTDPATFLAWNIGGTSAGGESQRYCICDVGCCAPTQEETIALDVTTSRKTLEWAGRTWSGPSDTGNPMGDYFLPGRYAVVVTFFGYAAGSVTAELPIEIVDP